MRKVIVSASTEYAVLIGRGLLAQLGTEVAKRIRPCKAAVITDTTVEKLYAEQAGAILSGGRVHHLPAFPTLPGRAPSISAH